jgi:hypothetical protein
MKIDKKSQVISRSDNKIVLYTDKRGNVELRADVEKDTIWATQDQIARLFDVDRSVVTKHVNNVLKDKELDRKTTCAKFAHVLEDGRQYLTNFYNLDVVLAVGYRTNSTRAIQFRQWATRILRECLIKGFNLDRRKIALSAERLEDVKEAIAFMESESRGGPLKAKMTVRLSRNLLP